MILPLGHHGFPTLPMFLAFFAGAAAEELGWSAYATEALQQRWQALPASLLLGLVPALFKARSSTHAWPGWS